MRDVARGSRGGLMAFAADGAAFSVAWMAGRVAEAEAINAPRRLDGRMVLEQQLAALEYLWMRQYQGRIGDVESEVEKYSPLLLKNPPPAIQLWLLLELASGREASAREGLVKLAANGFQREPYPNWAMAFWLAAEVCVGLGERELAPALYDQAQPIAHQSVGFGYFTWGSGSYQLGQLAQLMGCHDEARRHFEDALAMNQRIGHRPATARTMATLSQFLVEQGTAAERPRARQLAATALAEAELMDLRPVAAVARKVLGLVPKLATAYPAGLSAREVEVLKLVAEGLTNEEIGDRLVISRHTAARHVGNILLKVGVTSRRQARDFARTHNLA